MKTEFVEEAGLKPATLVPFKAPYSNQLSYSPINPAQIPPRRITVSKNLHVSQSRLDCETK